MFLWGSLTGLLNTWPTKITAYAFERTCQVANGYLKKQLKGKGSIGSDILLRIYHNYLDLSIFVWLLTGNGSAPPIRWKRQPAWRSAPTLFKDEMIQLMNTRIMLLKAALADKEKLSAYWKIVCLNFNIDLLLSIHQQITHKHDDHTPNRIYSSDLVWDRQEYLPAAFLYRKFQGFTPFSNLIEDNPLKGTECKNKQSIFTKHIKNRLSPPFTCFNSMR